jgi:glycosyltransferase involved in cell wall biosynthesis
MNVLLVSEPGRDGVFTYVRSLCQFLWRRGVRVHLAYSDRRGGPGLAELVAEVEARGGATLNLRVSNRPTLRDLAALGSLRRLAREIRPDVIHSHSSKAGALARALAWTGIRAVQFYHPHAYFGMRPNRRRIDRLFDAAERALGRRGRTIACSAAERAFATGRLGIAPDRVHAIANGVDTARFRPAAPGEKSRLRAAFGLPAAARILGFIGRSSAQKDPLTLYRAFARVSARLPDLTLFHVGRGELDSELHRLTAEWGLERRIFRLAHTDRPEEFYRAVDGFALPSRYEGLSLAALEALASDVPLVLSDSPGNADLLDLPLSHVRHASPGDVAGFSRAIEEWHRRPPGSASPINHRRIAGEYFDHERQFAAVLDLYVRTSSPPP